METSHRNGSPAGRADDIREVQSGTIRLEGRYFQRIRYGSERHDWGARYQRCDYCAVAQGEFHLIGCDIEECPRCLRQLISCECRR